MFARFLALLSILSAFAVAGCQQGPAQGPAVETSAQVQNFEYRLGAADKLRVIVFGEETLSGEFVVSGAGTVSMPLIGEIKAAGLTVPQVQAAIEERLRDGYLKDPKVSTEVLNYRPFYILGEVKKPGEYPYTNALTVMNAAARAEGFTYRADTRRVFIKHANETAEREYPLTSSTPVAPGDTVRVGERYF
ncbi:polysaccharide biosynthesis/export family protein [Caulobacter sp. 17J80-11]|uniref:polysaccharide biosynthesis/export family protein n=1 Tax=Caulobacter sp. 17J80-11 TaxID=2763502 RepID=UPI001653E990|nr:polysaccharide biosynthesis/export family protein [Caulobacter sp. 17J80-11]MBC6982489.1 polysaccharide export protein [Caulobacter sp. 17J80-11]